jgi:hypothetical protein
MAGHPCGAGDQQGRRRLDRSRPDPTVVAWEVQDRPLWSRRSKSRPSDSSFCVAGGRCFVDAGGKRLRVPKREERRTRHCSRDPYHRVQKNSTRPTPLAGRGPRCCLFWIQGPKAQGGSSPRSSSRLTRVFRLFTQPMLGRGKWFASPRWFWKAGATSAGTLPV